MSRSAIGWSKSISSRSSAWPRRASGSRRSAWIAAVLSPASSARLCVTTIGVVVHVDDARVGGDGLGDLVDVALGGQAAAEVDELPDPGLAGEEADDPAQEGPVVLDHVAGDRRDRQELFGHLAVGGEVVLAVQQVVVDARRVRHARVDRGGPVQSRGAVATARPGSARAAQRSWPEAGCRRRAAPSRPCTAPPRDAGPGRRRWSGARGRPRRAAPGRRTAGC